MEKKYVLKFPNDFADLLKYQKIMTLSLQTYLKIHEISIKENDIISLIFQVKENIGKNKQEKLENEFHELFCKLIESVVRNFKDEDLANYKIDNYGFAQLSLCDIVVQWIKTKEEVILEKEEIDYVFGIIHKFIKKEYGTDFLLLTKLISDCDIEHIKKITTPKEAILEASKFVTIIHPNELNGAISAYVLKNYEVFNQYKLTSLNINICEKNVLIRSCKFILKLLQIIPRMGKYKEITRLNFFSEFKGKPDYLNAINSILLKLKKKPLINLEDETQDIDLVIEKNRNLLKMNEELTKKNAEILSDLDIKIKEADKLRNEANDLKNKANDLKNKADTLQKDLKDKKAELKKIQDLNTDISTQLFNANNSLNKAKSKINDHLHREICGRIENYFFNIISPRGRQEINKQLEENKKINKIDAFVAKIDQEYPSYFNKIKSEGIDYGLFLYKVNYFRKKNNEECHDSSNVNYNSIINTLNNYFENSFDFRKHFDYMSKNFEQFKNYLFTEKFELNRDLYNIFQKKEDDLNL